MKNIELMVSNLNIEDCIGFWEYNNIEKIKVTEKIYSKKIQKIDINLLKSEDDIFDNDLYEFTKNTKYLSLDELKTYVANINYKRNESKKIAQYEELRKFSIDSKERMKLILLLMLDSDIKFEFMIEGKVVGSFVYKDFSCDLSIKKEFSQMINLLFTDTSKIEECHLKDEKKIINKDIEAFQKIAKKNDNFICLYFYEDNDPLLEGLDFRLINNEEVILEENYAGKSYYMKKNDFKIPKDLKKYSKYGIVIKENNYLISDFKSILRYNEEKNQLNIELYRIIAMIKDKKFKW